MANKVIEWEQCTNTWYVDYNNNMSHKNPEVVTKVLEEISDHFGYLVVSRGDKHELLGINIAINRKKKRAHNTQVRKERDFLT